MTEPKTVSTVVSVVVVSFNTCGQLRRCIQAIGPDHEVVVVDNASSDGSADMVEQEFPSVRLIRNRDNRGFGAANNQGIDAASHDLVLLLNSDCYAHPGAIDKLSSLFSEPYGSQIVAAGGRLLNPDGSLQQSSANALTLWAVFCEQTMLEKAFPGSRLLSPYWNSSQFEKAAPVAQVMGACLMMRRLEKFDERFFLYCEDTELCHRLSKLGAIVYEPAALFTHELGASSSADRWRSIALYNRGKELYFSIHFGTLYMVLCLVLDRLGALLRLIVWGLLTLASAGRSGNARTKMRMFWRVLTAPMQGPRTPRRSAG